MNGRWDLTILYNGFDDAAFAADIASLDENIKAVNTFAAELDSYADRDLIHQYITLAEKQSYLASKLFIYANLCYSGNTSDTKAASIMGQLMGKMSETAASQTAIQNRIASIETLEDIIDADPSLGEYRYLLM